MILQIFIPLTVLLIIVGIFVYRCCKQHFYIMILLAIIKDLTLIGAHRPIDPSKYPEPQVLFNVIHLRLVYILPEIVTVHLYCATLGFVMTKYKSFISRSVEILSVFLIYYHASAYFADTRPLFTIYIVANIVLFAYCITKLKRID